MKNKNIFKTLILATVASIGFISCEDFLDRPTEDGYTVSSFYQTDEQCLQAVNPIYNSPWHDFTRGFLLVGDIQAGNSYWEHDCLYFRLRSSNEELAGMSASLWSVNAHCNSIIENINMYAGSGTTETGRNMAKGEALLWKAMAYFYMVRIWGPVPIIHNNSAEIAAGNYNNVYKATEQNIYDYIILTLEQAVKWLPEKPVTAGRVDKYSAYGLLAKVYLTKAGVGMSNSRNQTDLDKAAEYASKVINESGRKLMPNYEDIFRLRNNNADESLIAWRWVVAQHWTASNPIQPDVTFQGMDGLGGWGSWRGISVDLMDQFNEDPAKLTRNNADKRRKATMMMYGDEYDYFWRDKGGFNWTNYQKNDLKEFHSSTGANWVKHIVGNSADQVGEGGEPITEAMKNSLATHILRLGDIYLVYAEAILGNNASTSDPKALEAFNAIRSRAGVSQKTVITFDDIMKERRLELACEGDNWYDFVRLAYYKPDDAINRLKSQRRKNYIGLTSYYMQDNPTITIGSDGLPSVRYNADQADLNITKENMYAPFPDVDLAMNPNLRGEPVEYDLSNYTY
ncbi:RagB/SusD family nutrient uptake outer membrane protein [Bacteroides sp. 519]|uniref:RagB/SusD family nutrient uptake outer membrane protein n=1 Tax=Bacteroides sp. 519 TaxID=2302937 RepID=UPI0013D883F9|nr:RagB/SusD family nutrient uptake outer membrane protein [Bacteroides sp. 519]NDV60563.1 RagB/SusD family nutrient uptake outer membrane protein [Bacteroides sp. 519]